MDSYCEHLIPMRKDKKAILLLVFIWAVLLLIIAFCFLMISKLGVFSFILTVAAVFGGVWLTKQLNVEYEYIFTNGEMDVDLITSRTDRKRLITFQIKNIERIEKYRAGMPMFEKEQYDKKSVYCNATDEDVYCISFKHKIGKVCLVMQIKKNMQEAMLPYLDKLLVREAFKD
ncbi:MAG: DUF6106 family protein [Acutalibacteraceae bacterium]|nr:DUF6106 family protein [Acutalibacteraceae bacterium]